MVRHCLLTCCMAHYREQALSPTFPRPLSRRPAPCPWPGPSLAPGVPPVSWSSSSSSSRCSLILGRFSRRVILPGLVQQKQKTKPKTQTIPDDSTSLPDRRLPLSCSYQALFDSYQLWISAAPQLAFLFEVCVSLSASLYSAIIMLSSITP